MQTTDNIKEKAKRAFCWSICRLDVKDCNLKKCSSRKMFEEELDKESDT